MPRYLELEVSLMDIKPRIWRRIQIRATATFEELHVAIQESLGWWNYHLWQFDQPDRESTPIAGPPTDDIDAYGPPMPDASRKKLSAYFSAGARPTRCIYVYDFGDGWEHDIRVRRVLTVPDTFQRRLLAGRRACPREDCGGVYGYYDCCANVRGETEDNELAEWIGDWDPDAFDLKTARQEFDK